MFRSIHSLGKYIRTLIPLVVRVPIGTKFHPALNGLREIVKKLHAMLDASEEHKNAFKEQPLVIFRRTPHLKDNLVRAKHPRSQTEGVRGCFKCGKVRCQVCSFTSEGNSLNVMFQEGNIIFRAIFLVILQV